MKLHLSPNVGGWVECRAKEGNCPFGAHDDLRTVLATARERHEKGEEVPSVRTTAATVRPISFLGDGTVLLGSRRYSEDGEPLLAGSSARARASKARKLAEVLAAAKPVMGLKEKLAKAEALVLRLLDVHGLWALGCVFKWNKRTRALGVTKFVGGKAVSVELSKPWAEVTSWEDLEDTVTHEIAHALAGPAAGHGPEWQAIHRELGGNGQACYHGDAELPKPWTWTCGVCGKSRAQLTAPRRVEVCSGCYDPANFDPRTILTWAKNGQPVAHEAMGAGYRRNWGFVKSKYSL